MSLPQRRLTPAEYLELERKAETKSEFCDGWVFAMSGADRRHDRIAINVTSGLNLQFRGGRCTVHSSDMRVKVSETGLYTYPDTSATCGKALYEDEHVDTFLNPSAIVEVLSKSTEAYDRGGKFAHYRRVPSLLEYVLISQDRPLVERYARQPDDSWVLTEKSRLEDVLELPSIGATLLLADIYDKVEWSDDGGLPGPRPA